MGILATIAYVTSCQMKTSTMIIRTHGLAALVMTAHMFLMGAPVAACVVLFAGLRSLLNSTDVHTYYKLGFAAVSLLMTLVYGFSNATEWWMLVCLAAPFIWTSTELYGNDRMLRSMGVVTCLIWFLNHIMVGSVGGIITIIFMLSSYGIAILRYDLQDWAFGQRLLVRA